MNEISTSIKQYEQRSKIWTHIIQISTHINKCQQICISTARNNHQQIWTHINKYQQISTKMNDSTNINELGTNYQQIDKYITNIHTYQQI